MSKRDYLIRFLLIIKKLRNSKYASFQEINTFLQDEFALIDAPKEISLRTFQRDLNEIRTIFNIDIQCNSENLYFIADDETLDFNNRMMEAFDVFNSLNTGKQLMPYILLEKRCSLGTEHIYGILHAIKNHLILSFVYQKYSDNNKTTRTVEPYALKEFRGRWYLLSKDTEDDFIKTFGLDRISQMEILKKKFNYPLDFNPKDHFEDCFGVITSDESEPEEIILSFHALQGQYIKSYPLHESQRIITESKAAVQVGLKLYITYDFIMELLSYGGNVYVEQPLSLRKTIATNAKRVTEMYKHRGTSKNKHSIS